MAVKVQFNPSTLKASWNPDTSKAQLSVPVTPGEDCEYCAPGSTPAEVTVRLSEFTLCPDCYEMIGGNLPYACGIIEATHASFSAPDISELAFVLPQYNIYELGYVTNPCRWFKYFNPYTTPAIAYGGATLWRTSGCDEDPMYSCPRLGNLYFDLTKISNTQAKIWIGWDPQVGPGVDPKAIVLRHSAFDVDNGYCIQRKNAGVLNSELSICGLEVIQNGWNATRTAYSAGTIIIEEGDTT